VSLRHQLSLSARAIPAGPWRPRRLRGDRGGRL